MKTLIVTRHLGAKEWLERQGLTIDEWKTHLTLDELESGDRIIGSLPVQMVAKLSERGVHYIHLSMEVPESLRGIELSVEQMEQCNVQLERISAVSHGEWPASA